VVGAWFNLGPSRLRVDVAALGRVTPPALPSLSKESVMVRVRNFREAYLALRAGKKVRKPVLYYIEQHADEYARFVEAFEAKRQAEVDEFVRNVLGRKPEGASYVA
jgi:hypothetical protein